MSYRLVYAWGGHEMTLVKLATLDAVNNTIRGLYDTHGSVTILRIEQDQDGPRTWQIEYPPAPPAGTRVRDRHGMIRTVGENGALPTPAGGTISWDKALQNLAPLTEVVETEVEAAARRLREQGYAEAAPKRRPGGDEWTKDVRTVLAHVLNGGQL